MANDKFDSKSFNPQAFKYMVGRVPNLKMNEIKKSKALAGNPDIKDTLGGGQGGTGYARIAMRGLLDGDAVNYDGNTDITATSTKTFEQGIVVVGRAKAWVERDFSYDITGGVDFMQNIADQVAEYKDGLDQATILAVLNGIFSMSSGVKNLEFVAKHTYDITEKVDGNMSATTLNSAVNQACGANKKKFALVFMHSDVSTNLENLKLVAHLKYTDKDGIERDLAMYTWNGKLVVVDDDMPTATQEGFYTKAKSTDEGALEVVANTATPTAKQIKLEDVTPVGTGYTTPAIGDYTVFVDDFTEYTTYVLGNGSISYEDLGVKVPYAMARDEKTNGGQDTLYMRQRKVFSPFGLSYEKVNQVSLSPTDAELSNGANWTVVHSGESVAANRSYINHKAIPIARIISRG
jgi:hypothetical protein